MTVFRSHIKIHEVSTHSVALMPAMVMNNQILPNDALKRVYSETKNLRLLAANEII